MIAVAVAIVTGLVALVCAAGWFVERQHRLSRESELRSLQDFADSTQEYADDMHLQNDVLQAALSKAGVA